MFVVGESWNLKILAFGDFEIWEIWNCGIREICSVGIGEFGALGLWDFGIVGCCDSRTLGCRTCLLFPL